ncbi:PEP-CTERM sorting domain-containing protein [Burkholderiaceae bacterium UC74_6]
MKKTPKLYLFALGLCCSALAHAGTVTWNLGGKIDDATGFDEVAVGDQVNVFVSFNTLAGLNLNPGRSDIPNGKYQYFGNSLTMDIWVNGVERGFFTFDPNYGGSMILRNNAPFPVQAVDGITFSLNEADDGGATLSLAAILRGTLLNVFSSGSLPSTPPAGLLSEETHIFQVCRTSANAQPGQCDLGQVDVTLDSINAVPEPTSLALSVLALSLAWGVRRRT